MKRPKTPKETKKRRTIRQMVSSALKRELNKRYMSRLDQVVSEAFRRHPFRYRMNEKLPEETIRPVAHWFIDQYIREQGLNKSQRVQLKKLLAMAETGEVRVSKKGAMPRETIARMDSLWLKGNLDELYDTFWRVMNRKRNVRGEYTEYLFSKESSPPYVNEKVHIIQFAPNYISNLFSKALDVLWAYKGMKKKQARSL